MIEARVNGKTKDKQLKILFSTSGSVANDPSRLAFALIPGSMKDFCLGRHIKEALQASPVEGGSIVNKVLVLWSHAVPWKDGKPVDTGNMPSIIMQKNPDRRV